MSAFLGPIHYWLYNKIQLQQALVDKISDLGNQQGLSLKKDCESRFGVFENKPLEEMIDHGNIHGWLQERVSQVEYKYAYSITTLLEKNPELLEELSSLHYNYGKELALSLKRENPEKFTPNASQVYKIISDYLLDGMPCDHANQVIHQNETEVIWERRQCVHGSYWEEVGGDITIYYKLRDAWMNGLINELGLLLEKPDATSYSIKVI